MFKRIINITIWTIIGLYAAIVILLHIPFIETYIGGYVGEALCQKFGTKVSVGRVDLGFANRLIIDDSQMQDQQGKQMLRVSRISVKVNLMALTTGRIEITSAQFFGLNANLYKTTAEAKPNFQFVIDSLASKDTTKEATPIDLQINSLIIRHGKVSYRVLSDVDGTRRFSPHNIEVNNISTHIILNRLTNDSLNLKVKRMAFDERCGFRMKSLSLNAIVSKSGARIENFRMELPSTLLLSDGIFATYRINDGKLEMPTLQFNGNINAPRISPDDLAGFVPKLGAIGGRFSLSSEFYGTASSVRIKKLEISSNDGEIMLAADANMKNYPEQTEWYVNLQRLHAKNGRVTALVETFTNKKAPEILGRIGDIEIKGYAGGIKNSLVLNAKLGTGVGNVDVAVDKSDRQFTGNIKTQDMNLGRLANNDKAGHVSLGVNVKGRSEEDFTAAGKIYDIDYNGYKYKNVDFDASYKKKVIEGRIGINDPNIQIAANGLVDISGKTPRMAINSNVERLNPEALHLTNKWKSTDFACNLNVDINGTGLHDAVGTVQVGNFVMRRPDSEYGIENIEIKTGTDDGRHFINMESDFGSIDINGHFSYNTIATSVLNMVTSKLPTIPGLAHKQQQDYNDFTINATINNTRWAKELLNIPLDIHRPLNISGSMDDRHEKIDLWCDIPSFTYNGNAFKDAYVSVESPNDTLKANVRIKKIMNGGKIMSLKLNAGASDNHLNTSLTFSNNMRHPLKGTLNASTVFARNKEGAATAYVDVLESHATIGDTTWQIKPASIIYSKNRLQVDGFAIKHGKQYIAINGTATKSHNDSLVATLNDIDVSYVLNLVNFHSVDFFGMASGNAYVAGLFGKAPKIDANLQVDDFKFETGRMGTLYANVGYDTEEGRINIDATAKDEGERQTIINGYVSPKHNYIDLGINAHNTRAEFMESFCGSFMDNVDAGINGKVNVVGPLSNINLVGKAVVNGSVHMTALNTTYWMRNDSVTFIPDEIIFKGDTLYDRNGNIGLMTGSIYHKHLTNLSYNLGIKAKNLLAYDTHSFGDNTFYGTAYVTGDCNIKGKSGEVVIDINATPEKNSIIVYNATDRNNIGEQDYITWKKHPEVQKNDSLEITDEEDKRDNFSTNIYLNFLVSCTPNATLKLIMDEASGDYISLYGDGVLRAAYFNKGTFDIYGNYTIDHGVYKLTMQNIIKKEFQFEKGGTISFGGDPYKATLDLKALYVLNSVSLADLKIGRSFSNNNVRVNCLMNIVGTPEAPKVTFSLDMPTLGNDAKQMVYSLLNAEEEMNQQVLYLLAVGRFYSQSNNSSDNNSQPYSQTSLAMQSFLSGTVSQQINNVLSKVVKSSNWNFGANISPGTEGFNNAEYEGLLSGSLFNNRLLINGQFGYRDNTNATTSFIGDFDIKYMLFPNGNLAINVYNKTNDRYFTKNSLNTQGLGMIMKKDFTKISDLFFWRKKKNK